jgi:dCTP deaminase
MNAMTAAEENLFGKEEPSDGESYGRFTTGILPGHVLRRLIRARREVVATEDIEDAQIQPASIDLRLGAGGLAGAREFPARPNATVRDKLGNAVVCTRSTSPTARCWRPAASMSCRCWKALEFSPRFRRRQSEKLDRAARRLHAPDHRPGAILRPHRAGLSRAALCRDQPRTFPILVRKGSRLNQLRVRRGSPQFTDTQLRACTPKRRW